VENRPLFQLLVDTLHRLCQGKKNELTLRYFEMHLLNTVGYRPQLQRCVSCRSPLKPITNYFSSSAGGVFCPDCSRKQASSPLSVNALKVLRFFQDSDYATSNRLKMNAELSQELEQIMRSYLKYLLEGEIKSTAWRDSLRKQKEQTALLQDKDNL